MRFATTGETLVRFIKPAARSMELPWVNWRSMRTSHATWLKMAGADVKDAQAPKCGTHVRARLWTSTSSSCPKANSAL